MRSIYVMRHGSTVLDVDRRSDGWLDMPLSDEGRLGLMDAQQYLKTKPIKTVFSPDLKRTQETANIIKSGTMSDPKMVSANEARTWNLGMIAGMKKRYGRPEVQKLIDDPTTAPKGGESFNTFKGRFMTWFNKNVANAKTPVLFVGSGSNLRLLGQELLGDPDELDLDEGGLACLCNVNGNWYCEIVHGADDQQAEIS